jgi:hypothetical protein
VSAPSPTDEHDTRPGRPGGLGACALRPGEPAAFLCARCDAPTGWSERRVGAHGLAVCSRCHHELGGARVVPWEDPTEDSVALAFLKTVAAMLLSPRAFIQERTRSPEVLPAVAFGALCMGLFPTISVLYLLATGDTLDIALVELFDAANVPTTPTSRRLAAMIAPSARVPFVFLCHACTLWLATRALGARTRLRDAARMLGYPYAAYALALVPPVFGLPLGFTLGSILFFNGLISSLVVDAEMTPGRALGATMMFAMGAAVLQMV